MNLRRLDDLGRRLSATAADSDRHSVHDARRWGRPIFFWIDGEDEPRDHVRRVPRVDRKALAEVLAAGRVLARYRGMARCRICGERLGSQTLGAHGFVWPQRAEHYVMVHSVWPPGATELARKAGYAVPLTELGAASGLPADVEAMIDAAAGRGIASGLDRAGASGAAFGVLFTPLTDHDTLGPLPALLARVASHRTELAAMSPADQRKATRGGSIFLNFFPVRA